MFIILIICLINIFLHYLIKPLKNIYQCLLMYANLSVISFFFFSFFFFSSCIYATHNQTGLEYSSPLSPSVKTVSFHSPSNSWNRSFHYAPLMSEEYQIELQEIHSKIKSFQEDATEYYSKRYEESEDYKGLDMTLLWKDNDVELDHSGKMSSSSPLARLSAYSEGNRLSSQIRSSVQLWVQPVFRAASIDPFSPSTVIVSLFARDPRNPYWFWKPRMTLQRGGGIDAYVTSLPGYAAPLKNDFSLPRPSQHYKLPSDIYTGFCFPVVVGATYHLQLLNIKNSPHSKRWRVIPASLHDLKRSMRRGRVVKMLKKEFNSLRLFRKGRMYLTDDAEDIPPSETITNIKPLPSHLSKLNTDPPFWKTRYSDDSSTNGNSSNFYNSNPIVNTSDNNSTIFTDPFLQHETQSRLIRTPQENLSNWLGIVQDTINTHVAALVDFNQTRHIIDKITNQTILGQMLTYKKKNAFIPGTIRRHNQNYIAQPLIELLKTALNKNDWSTVRLLERARHRAKFTELQYLFSKRQIMLSILFEEHFAEAIHLSFLTLDNRSLRLLFRMSQRRLWRGVLLLLYQHELIITDHKNQTDTNDIPSLLQNVQCPDVVFPHNNGSKISLSIQESLIPDHLLQRSFYEVKDEKIIQFYQLQWFKHRSTYSNDSDMYNSLSQWFSLHNCSTHHLIQTNYLSFKECNLSLSLLEKCDIADPAVVIAKMLKPILFSHNLYYIAIALQTVVNHFPSVEANTYLTKSLTKTFILNTNSSLSKTDNDLEWATQWFKAFLHTLGTQLARTTYSNGTVPYPVTLAIPLKHIKHIRLKHRLHYLEQLERQRMNDLLNFHETGTAKFSSLNNVMSQIKEYKETKQIEDFNPFKVNLTEAIAQSQSAFQDMFNPLIKNNSTEHLYIQQSKQINEQNVLVIPSQINVTDNLNTASSNVIASELSHNTTYNHTSLASPSLNAYLTGSTLLSDDITTHLFNYTSIDHNTHQYLLTNFSGFPQELANLFDLFATEQLYDVETLYFEVLQHASPQKLLQMIENKQQFDFDFNSFPNAQRRIIQKRHWSSPKFLQWLFIPQRDTSASHWRLLAKELKMHEIDIQRQFQLAIIRKHFYIEMLQRKKKLNALGIKETNVFNSTTLYDFMSQTDHLNNLDILPSWVLPAIHRYIEQLAEDMQRIILLRHTNLYHYDSNTASGYNSTTLSGRLGMRQTPIWDTITLKGIMNGRSKPLVTFLIDQRDDHSYFFKGRKERYEPNILTHGPKGSSGYGMLAGHHFGVMIR